MTEGQPCAALNESNAGISFNPFYGKFATTGQAIAAQTHSEEAESKKPVKPKGPKPHTPPAPTGAPAPQHAPAPEPPSTEKTGGAGPH